MLVKRRPGQFYSALEGQRGDWLPRLPKCRHLVLPSVIPLAVRPAPCRPDPPVVCSGFGLDRYFEIHVNEFYELYVNLYVKGIQKQITVGILVNSQQRRALAASLIITADKPVVNR